MFLESTLFLQKLKNFKKQCYPVLATQSWVIQVACYSRKLTCWFWRLVCEWKVQSWGVHRDFRGSARDSLVGRPSSREKHLENFSLFWLWVFWRLTLTSCWQLSLVTKNTCFAFQKQFLKPFLVFFFPLNLLWLFIVFFVWTSLKDTVFTHKLSWISLSLHQSLRKGMDFVSFSVCSSYLALYLLDCVFFFWWSCFIPDTWI